MQRAAPVAFALVLLSPAQFPWYMIWMMPFLAFRPYWGLLATAVTVPLYYAAFHFIARGRYDVFAHGIVWGIWAPVWLLLAAEVVYKRRSAAAPADSARRSSQPKGP
jgi:hypothetical protein